MTILNKTDEYLKNRLIWKAKKYLLPSEYSFFHSDLTHEQQKYLSAHVDPELVGIPVLFFTKPGKEWTLICTRQLVGFNNHNFYSLPFKEAVHIAPSTMIGLTEGRQRLESVKQIGKAEWDQLALTDRTGRNFLFHANKGADFFAMWNIILMAIKLYDTHPDD